METPPEALITPACERAKTDKERFAATADIELRHGIRFEHYFADELQTLESLRSDGILERDARQIRVMPRGRLLMRNVVRAFAPLG